MDNSVLLTLMSLLLASFWILPAQSQATTKFQSPKSDSPNFHNQTGCLYAYIGDDCTYLVTFTEDLESVRGQLSNMTYDSSKSNCTNGIFPGNLVVKFITDVNQMDGMWLELQIKPSPSEGYWEINNATLVLDNPRNEQIFPSRVIELKATDMYAGDKFSYSCNRLVLQNRVISKDGPHFKITLRQFQIQPFKELDRYVFAPSFDCAVWITLPVLMGLILVLFIIFTVMIGVYLLMEQGNQQGDLKFSKQGGMLMNQAQLDATKG